MTITVTKRIEQDGKAVEHTATAEFSVGPSLMSESKEVRELRTIRYVEERTAALFKALPSA